jgi:hypothetical protein
MSSRASADLELEVNPQGIQGSYLSGLDRSFRDWGGPETYRWAFQREGLSADLMVLRRGGRLVAGSAVSYRRVALPAGGRVGAGIMTGSWTLPEARGLGCFTRMIGESLRLAADRGAALLLAFVTRDNPSCRRLLAAGGAGFPSAYLASTDETPLPPPALDPRPVADPETVARELFEARKQEQAGFSHFDYPAVEIWASQFLNRPGVIEMLSFGGQAWAIVERAPSTDRVHLIAVDRSSGLTHSLCLAALLRGALDRGRRLFLFTTLPALAEVGRGLGLAAKPGLLTALIASTPPLREALGAPAEEPEGSADLSRGGSGWYLGEWDLQGGDRM